MSKHVTLKELKAIIKAMDKELNILHEAITELYNLDENVPIIKAALAKIDKIE